MRISDWSSDVCSSDLGFSVLEQPEVTVTYEQRIERGGKREARLAYASRGLDLAEAQARLRRLELAQQVQRAFIDVQIADQLVWISERRLETERQLQRSEEHTSELQSLMRISYAVFCLQKKKKYY